MSDQIPYSKTKEYRKKYYENYDDIVPYTQAEYGMGSMNLLRQEKDLICKALVKANAKFEIASDLLGISVRTLYRKMYRHQLEPFLQNLLQDVYKDKILLGGKRKHLINRKSI